ncbi:MAG: DUF6326 family protein [Myxococcota bacterium]
MSDPTSLARLRHGARLSSLWAFVLLCMLFRDMHEIPTKEFLEEALSRTVPEWLFLVAGMVLTLPLLMVPLNGVFSRVWGRPTNLVAVLVMLASAASYPPGDLDDWWFAGVEAVGLLVIAWLAWSWPAPAPEASPAPSTWEAPWWTDLQLDRDRAG